MGAPVTNYRRSSIYSLFLIAHRFLWGVFPLGALVLRVAGISWAPRAGPSPRAAMACARTAPARSAVGSAAATRLAMMRVSALGAISPFRLILLFVRFILTSFFQNGIVLLNGIRP